MSRHSLNLDMEDKKNIRLLPNKSISILPTHARVSRVTKGIVSDHHSTHKHTQKIVIPLKIIFIVIYYQQNPNDLFLTQNF